MPIEQTQDNWRELERVALMFFRNIHFEHRHWTLEQLFELEGLPATPLMCDLAHQVGFKWMVRSSPAGGNMKTPKPLKKTTYYTYDPGPEGSEGTLVEQFAYDAAGRLVQKRTRGAKKRKSSRRTIRP